MSDNKYSGFKSPYSMHHALCALPSAHNYLSQFLTFSASHLPIFLACPATRTPYLATRNTLPATRNTQPATRTPATRTSQPATRNSHPATRTPQLATRIQYQVSSIEYPVSSIQYPVSSYPASNRYPSPLIVDTRGVSPIRVAIFLRSLSMWISTVRVSISASA
jgi:hypothetical protein